MDLARIQLYLWLASPGIYAIWAIRVLASRLASRYPFLVAFLVSECVLNLAGYAIYQGYGLRSAAYRWYFIVSHTANSTLLLLVLAEVYQRLTSDFEGLRRLGQWFVRAALAVATIIVFGSVLLNSGSPQSLIEFWTVQERSIFLSLTTITVGLVGFAVYFRLSPSRNVLVILAVFGLSFIGRAVLWALVNLLDDDFLVVRDLLNSILQNACILAGALAFSRAGEKTHSQAQPATVPILAGEDAVRRLEALNELLMKVFRLTPGK